MGLNGGKYGVLAERRPASLRALTVLDFAGHDPALTTAESAERIWSIR
jgi:hypothetical protein